MGISIITLILGIVAIILGISCAKSAAEKKYVDDDTLRLLSKVCAGVAAFCLVIAIISPIFLPQYRVWQQNKEGEAELARAEQNRKIAIEEARAKEEAAMSLANAEVIRAQGVAQANKIIGDSLQNNDAYIHYLWIETLRESNNEIIYIPTEAGIPITESARFFRKD